MAQREWVEKDFYKTLGVSSDATADEIKRAARKLLAENHPAPTKSICPVCLSKLNMSI